MSEMEASDGGALPVILRRHGRCCSDRKAHGWQGAHVHSPSACRKKRLPGFLKTDLKVLLEKHAAAVTAVRQGGSAKGPEAGARPEQSITTSQGKVHRMPAGTGGDRAGRGRSQGKSTSALFGLTPFLSSARPFRAVILESLTDQSASCHPQTAPRTATSCLRGLLLCAVGLSHRTKKACRAE